MIGHIHLKDKHKKLSNFFYVIILDYDDITWQPNPMRAGSVVGAVGLDKMQLMARFQDNKGQE